MTPTPLKVAIKDDGRGARAIADALRAAGHEIVRGPAHALLVDLDAPIGGYRELIDLYKANGAKILLYPHGAGPILVYDNLYEPYEAVDANLTIGSGQVELLRRLDYQRPAHAIGWYQCPQLPFRPRADVRHVVFAPTHPGGDGSLLPLQRDDNAEIFDPASARTVAAHRTPPRHARAERPVVGRRRPLRTRQPRPRIRRDRRRRRRRGRRRHLPPAGDRARHADRHLRPVQAAGLLAWRARS